MNHESIRYTNLGPDDHDPVDIPSDDEDEPKKESDKPFPKGDPPQRPIRPYKEPVSLIYPPKTIKFI